MSLTRSLEATYMGCNIIFLGVLATPEYCATYLPNSRHSDYNPTPRLTGAGHHLLLGGSLLDEVVASDCHRILQPTLGHHEIFSRSAGQAFCSKV